MTRPRLRRSENDGSLSRLLGAALVTGTVLVGAGCHESAKSEQAVREPMAPDTALRSLAEELTPAVERSAGLRFRRPPRLARSSRDALEDFLVGELDDQLPPQRADAIRDAYARFGLLSDTLDLRGLLRELYLEQVVGYYDPARDTLFVREGVAAAQLRPVLVHELVHALQDQHQDLDSLMEAREEANDAATAARAALEGHATFVMTEWQLEERTGRDVDLSDLPDLGGLLGAADLSALSSGRALREAPPVIRASLLFPYVGGVSFVQRLWREREGRPTPLGALMPASTEQVIHPRRLIGTPRDVPTRVSFGSAPEGWEERYADGLGEMETRLFLEAFLADTARARRAAAGWDGDGYRLLRAPDGGEALAWVTVWDSPADAQEFLAAARDAYAARYGEGRRRPVVRAVEHEGRPVVTVWDAPPGTPEAGGGRALEARLEERG